MRLRWLLLVLLAAPLVAHAAPVSKPRALKSAMKSATKPAEWKPVVPFIEDDFGRALALAKERKLPVFIEGWAPW